MTGELKQEKDWNISHLTRFLKKIRWKYLKNWVGNTGENPELCRNCNLSLEEAKMPPHGLTLFASSKGEGR